MVDFLASPPAEFIFIGLALFIIGILVILAGVSLDSPMLGGIGLGMLVVGIAMLAAIAISNLSILASDAISSEGQVGGGQRIDT